MIMYKTKQFNENDISFWKNSSKIEQYANGLLSYFDTSKNKSIIVNFGDKETYPECATYNINNQETYSYNYNISIPRIDFIDLSDDEKRMSIYTRLLSLKHEIAHVVYTDFKKLGELQLNKRFINYIEDVRVDYNFMKNLKGTKRLFAHFAFMMIQRKKKNLQFVYTYENFALYMRARIFFPNGYFTQTPVIKKFEELYKKYSNSILTGDGYYLTLQLLYNEFDERSEHNVYEDTPENVDELIAEYKRKNKVLTSGDDYGSDPENAEQSEENIYNIPKKLDFNEDMEYSAYDTDTTDDFSDIERLMSGMNFNGVEDLIRQSNIKLMSSIKQFEDIERLVIRPQDVEDCFTVKISDFYSLVNGISVKNIKGFNAYKRVVLENQKIIKESIRFLTLKIQNRNRTKNKVKLREGILDQNEIHNVLVEGDEPRVFMRQIKAIEPTATIHVLIDISGSMGSHKISLCIINAIILMEICMRMNIKYTFQMFTSVSGKMFKVRTSIRNPYTLLKVYNHYKYNTKEIYVKFDGDGNNLYLLEEAIKDKNNFTRVVTYISIQSRYRSGASLMYLKDANEQLGLIHKKIIGNLFISSKKISSQLSSNTPEFEAMAQVFKMFSGKTDKNILFLINDGGYDCSFASTRKIDSQSYMKNNRKDFYKEYGFTANNEEHMIEKLLKEKDAFENFMYSTLDNSDIYFFIEQYNTANNYDLTRRDIKNFITKTLNSFDIVIQDIKDKKIQMTKLMNEQITFNAYGYIRTMNGGYDYKNKSFALVSMLVDDFNKGTEVHSFIYKSMIKYMRARDWNIIGAGISSSLGINYIGRRNFTDFKNVEDIKENFSKKLRTIF